MGPILTYQVKQQLQGGMSLESIGVLMCTCYFVHICVAVQLKTSLVKVKVRLLSVVFI